MGAVREGLGFLMLDLDGLPVGQPFDPPLVIQYPFLLLALLKREISARIGFGHRSDSRVRDFSSPCSSPPKHLSSSETGAARKSMPLGGSPWVWVNVCYGQPNIAEKHAPGFLAPLMWL